MCSNVIFTANKVGLKQIFSEIKISDQNVKVATQICQ
jgi:hypothetical protein